MSAQSQGQSVIANDVRVEGAQRIEPDTVRSYVSIRRGDPITAQAMDESLKKLFATGLFADVLIRQEGDSVVVRVVENPIINRIAFEGNKRITNEVLRDEVKLRPRVVYTRTRVQSDVQRLIDVYRRSGRFAATVEPKVVQLPQNRVDLIFEVNEGPETEIRRITFIGNKRFSDKALRGVVQTKETAWYRFLSSDDTYDPDRLTFDRELLRRFYLSQGYADFRVVSAVAELTPDREGFFVTFTIEEGERYRFGKVDVSSALRDLKPEALRSLVTIREGDWYDADAVEQVITRLTEEVGNLGYAFVEIRPQVRRDREKRVIDVTFNVREGPRVFVERIDIEGNVRTIDKVIRREFPLVEGDAFNASKLNRARRRIQNLGFFEKVEVSNTAGSAPDKTVIKANVRERATGEISFGAGFSSSAGVLGDIGIRERNLLGKGQDLFLKFQLGASASEIELSFTEPYFMDRKLSAGFDIFHSTRDLTDESSYERETTGFGFRMGYNLTEHLDQSLRYRFSRDEVMNVESDASLAVREQEGVATTSLVGQTLTLDRRDSRFDPTDGYVVRWFTDLAGLGGSVHYLRNRVTGTHFFPLPGQLVLSIGGGAGYILGINDDVRITDRFYLGGASLRGFATYGAGPRDIASDDALGGNWYYNNTVEVSFPLGLPNEFGIRGRVFNDIGSIGKVDVSSVDTNDTGSLRAAAGIGVSWKSPFGPVSMDIGKAYLKEDFDDLEIVRFNFGTRF
ncbi:MAG: outer membrane protein assembly factor BamA [Alphaproteobacteria bacterium]|nr:outer membrane protein assembly factor BamA [Alphaproteobacteria bacterium]